MKKVLVDVPITGILHIEVEVDDNATRDEIYGAAMDAYSEDESVGDLEWEDEKCVCQGNVFRGMLNELRITTVKDS